MLVLGISNWLDLTPALIVHILSSGFSNRLPLSYVGEAVFARCLSSLKEERVQASRKLKGPQKVQLAGSKESFLEDIRKVGSPLPWPLWSRESLWGYEILQLVLISSLSSLGPLG